MLAVGELQGLHGAGQRLGAGFQQEGHVIPHQDVGVECNPVSAARAFEPVEIRGVIGLVMEDGRALVAADDDMEEGAGKVEAWFASHAGEARTRAARSRYSCQTLTLCYDLFALIFPVTFTLKPFLAKKGHTAEEVDKMYNAWVKSCLLQLTLWSHPYVKTGDF